MPKYDEPQYTSNDLYSEPDVQALIEIAREQATRAKLPLTDLLLPLIAIFFVLFFFVVIPVWFVFANYFPWEVRLVVIAICVFPLWWFPFTMWRSERIAFERKKTFGLISQKLGLEHERFQLTTLGRLPLLDNLMYGMSNGTRFAVFDYHYSLPKIGKVCQTVVWLHRPEAQLPDFAIGPGSWLSRDLLDLLTGREDFNFESHPAFLKNHQIRGRDVNTIRELFTADVLNFYEQHPGRTTEVSGSKLLYYRAGVRDNHRSFLNEALQLLALFQPANRS